MLGVSDASYYSTPEYPLYGTRQESECAGTIWLFRSTLMMETIEKMCQDFDIASSNSSQSRTKYIVGVVDDKRQYTNDWKLT